MKRTLIGLVLVGLLLIFASCNGDPISEPYVPSNPLPANELKVGSHDPLFIHFALNHKEELADSGGVENCLSVYGNMEYEHLETMYEYTSNGSRAIMTLYFRSKTVFESGTYHFSKEDKGGVLFGGDVAYYPVWNPKWENAKSECYN